MNTQIIIFALLAFFILHRVYRRLRRNFGWQPLNSRRLQVSTVIMTIFGFILFISGSSHISSLISDLAGTALGIILATCSAAMTRFEQREGQLHYMPNLWIGMIVTLLFLIRFLFRFYVAFTQTGVSSAEQWQGITGGWTAGLMFVMISYYATYNLFLLRKQKAKMAEPSV